MNTRSFVASMVVLAALMLLAGVLTLVVPAGSYQRAVDANGAELVVPGSYVQGAGPEYPVWRWLTAPLEVLASEDAALAIVIIVFITVVGEPLPCSGMREYLKKASVCLLSGTRPGVDCCLPSCACFSWLPAVSWACSKKLCHSCPWL